jgi:rhamnosyltransferase
MKIAILGSRGIPAKYGGFETIAEELSKILVNKGHKVTVSCEYKPKKSRITTYEGVNLEYFNLKPPGNYFLRKIYENIYDIYFLIKLARRNDLIYFLGAEVAEFFFVPKLFNRNIKIAANTDGAMWLRNKFSRLERFILKLNYNFLAMIFSDIIIVDAEGMKKFVNDKYHYKTFFIPYGANLIDEAPWDEDKLETLNIYNKLKQYITMNRYWLVVSRLEPGNNIEVIIKAFLEAKTKFPLIIVGNFANNKFRKEIENLVAMSKDRIFLTGGIYESEVLEILRQNCFAYIHGHSTGGTNPSLLEIMISKTIIIAHDNMFNKEVCQDTALYFNSVNDLKNKLGMLESNPSPYVDLKEKAYNRVRENYNWDKIINEYENVFLNALNP